MENKDYGYFSKVLMRPFDTLDELKKAEAAKKAEDEAKLKAANERKEAAAQIDQLYKDYVLTVQNANKIISEAKEKYLKAKAEFSKKYEGYHVTQNSEGVMVEKEDLDINKEMSNMFNAMSNGIFRMFGLGPVRVRYSCNDCSRKDECDCCENNEACDCDCHR